jgi:hypothetical protein
LSQHLLESGERYSGQCVGNFFGPFFEYFFVMTFFFLDFEAFIWTIFKAVITQRALGLGLSHDLHNLGLDLVQDSKQDY